VTNEIQVILTSAAPTVADEADRAAVSQSGVGVAEDIVELVLAAAGGLVDVVISAIRDDNASADLQVIDRGASVSVRASRSLQITASTLRWHAGGRFGLPELTSMIVSSKGSLTATSQRLVWMANGHS
jgi:3-deoxy-D-manno-octulosonate 8-phosphate phosphatase KdsC-like HAD superfamily phosphatase